MARRIVLDARAEALFVTDLQRSERPTTEQVRVAVQFAIRERGSKGCAAQVAAEFGEHPETAVERMRWARKVVGEVFHTGRRSGFSWRPDGGPDRMFALAAGSVW